MRKPCHESDLASAIANAATQIELALNESHAPVDRLGESIRKMAIGLPAIRRSIAAESSARGTDAGALDSLLCELQADVNDGIMELQFHDRMAQLLMHVRDFLAAIANRLEEDGPASASDAAATSEDWDALTEKLRQRLISDDQRQLFDLLLRPALLIEGDAEASEQYAAQGSVDLF